MDELEEIRKRRLLDLQNQQMGSSQESANQAMQQQEMQAERESQKQAILRQLLTPEARERLATLKMSRNEFATQIEEQIIHIAQSGRIRGKITDEKLKEILLQMQPKKRETSIKRV
ncbi:MAG: DNA-binding protein [Methanosarcinaceae archaeon]|jgi:programmed cell death protein 5|nr:DNA-binding protein [Methanosarcinaceae archaeon]NKQ38125.1 DNA-binding protein [Methanosarcinales archaeon]